MDSFLFPTCILLLLNSPLCNGVYEGLEHPRRSLVEGRLYSSHGSLSRFARLLFAPHLTYHLDTDQDSGSSLGTHGSTPFSLLTAMRSVHTYRFLHAILMWLALTLLLPLAVMIARYGKESSLWFHAHWILQLVSSAMVAVSATVALLMFRSHLEPHAMLGLVLCLLLIIQLAMGLLFRPQLGGRKRPGWNTWHCLIGQLIIAVSFANVFLGIKLYSKKVNSNLLWVFCVVAVQMVVLLLLFLLLDWRSWRMQEGAREPPTPTPCPAVGKKAANVLPEGREPPKMELVMSVSKTGRIWTNRMKMDSVQL